MSKNRKVLSSIVLKKQADPSLNLSLDKLHVEKAQHICGNFKTDELGFEVAESKMSDSTTTCTTFNPLMGK